jgi:hypothetical protein
VSSPKAIYLEGAADPIFAVLHRPTSRFAQDTAVILCPTFWHKINRASAKRALATLGWAFGALRPLAAGPPDARRRPSRPAGRPPAPVGQARTLEHIPVRDHTLRPGWAQIQAHGVLDRALERELTGPADPGWAGLGWASLSD